MTAIRAFSSNVNSAGITTVPRPIGTQTGDLVVAHIFTTGAASTMAGWNSIDTISYSAYYFTQAFWYVATAGDPANFTWTPGGGAASQMAICTAWANADTTTPIDGTPAKSNTNTVGSVTTAVDNDVLLVVSAATPNSAITGMTYIVELEDGTSLAMELAYDSLGAAGATGTRSATTPGTVFNMMSFAIRDSGAPPVIPPRVYPGLFLPV